MKLQLDEKLCDGAFADARKVTDELGRNAAVKMKCHLGVDADSGWAYRVRGTSGAVSNVIEANGLVRASEHDVYADAGYQGAGPRPDARRDVNWRIAMRPGKRSQLKPIETLTHQLERARAGIRARVEHLFRVLKRQFGHAQVRYQ